MSAESLGAAMKRFRELQDRTQVEIADSLHVSENSVGRWERDERTPSTSELDRFAQLLNLVFPDRAYLYELRHTRIRNMRSAQLTDAEVERCLDDLDQIHDQSRVPVIVIKYDHTIYRANRQAIALTNFPQEAAESAVKNHLSLFDAIFDDHFGLRQNVDNFQAVALDTIRDFMSVNALRRHEIFYTQYPGYFSERPWFENFKNLWELATKTNPYYELLKQRGLNLGAQRIIFRKNGTQRSFYLSRHIIPILANEYRILRFVPYDDATWNLYTPSRPEITLNTEPGHMVSEPPIDE